MINLGLDKAILSINPTPFSIWNELYWAIERDKDMLDGGKQGWTWINWALHALAGMADVNLKAIRELR